MTKPIIELKKVGESYIVVVDPGSTITAIYLKNKDGTVSLARSTKRKVDSKKALAGALDISQRGEAAARRAAFVVHQGDR